MATDLEKQAAVEQAVALVQSGKSSNAASETVATKYGVTGRTIQTWCKNAGHSLGDLSSYEVPQKAIDAYTAQAEAARIELRAVLVMKALEGAKAADPGDPNGFQKLSVGVGTFLDKYRLEMGEVTGRVETVDVGTAVQVVTDEVARLRERRAKSA